MVWCDFSRQCLISISMGRPRHKMKKCVSMIRYETSISQFIRNVSIWLSRHGQLSNDIWSQFQIKIAVSVRPQLLFGSVHLYNFHCIPSSLVNGGFSNWSAYGACSKSCDAGTKARTRKCNNPAPAYGGGNCVGPTTQSTECKVRECPGGYCCYISVIFHNYR